jgi:hypothetical protein
VYVIFRPAYFLVRIAFNAKNLHKGSWTKMSVLTFIPSHNDGHNCPFRLLNDATGAALSQGPIGKNLPIAYASRSLNNAERNYPTVEKELLAIVWGCKHFRQYLHGRKFTIVTDHCPLTSIFRPGKN